jgi:uncharacterized membrane protein
VALAALADAGLVGLGLVAGAVVLVCVAGKLPARTGTGRALHAQATALRRYLKTVDAARIRQDDRERILSELLPYAMAFGLARRWSGAFTGVGASPGINSNSHWYIGTGSYQFDRSMGSFEAVTGDSMSSRTPSTSDTSGFSGGAGYSDGGGGGGGGGSW